MKSEPLNIRDKTFLINRTIQQAPTGTLVREFFKNAEESAALAPEENRRVQIYPVCIDGVRKLAFWNTGPGMGAEDLRLATDLSSSINKAMALDGNFGIGAKVSGLAVSKVGIRYRSCKEGRVHQVIIGYDEDQQTYVRFVFQLSDNQFDTILDVTETAKAEGAQLGFDWTEVVLFGEAPEHDTVAQPLGLNKEVDRSYIPTAIFRRFAEWHDDLEVKIDVAMTKGGGKDETGRFRQLKLLKEVLPSLPMSGLILDSETGISVRYVHDPKSATSAHSLSAIANAATSSTTFCALVHKGERYDFRTKKSWGSIAPNFGIPFGSRVLTVEIVLPPQMAMPNQYRDQLAWPEDRSQMSIEQFSGYVRKLMPEWVREIIRKESPESGENLDDIQSELQKILDEFRVPTTALKPSRKSEAVSSHPAEIGHELSVLSELIENEIGGGEENGQGNHNLRSGTERRAQASKVRKAPEGALASVSTRALERVPEVKILDDSEEIAEKGLKGRAGKYFKDGQELFINGLYSAVDRMASELALEFEGVGDPEEVRAAAARAARKSMAFRIGKAVCFALSKRLVDDWSNDDLDKATSPESLSIAADDYRQSVVLGRRWIKEALKINRVEEMAS